MGGLYQLFQPFVDFIFPPTCLMCRTVLEEDDRHLCRQCWNSIPLVTRRHQLYRETKTRLTGSGMVSDLASLFIFEKEGAFQALAHALKYEGFQSAGRMVGGELGEQILNWGVAADMIIPVPLHKAKLRERGFNQAESIARGISDVTGWPTVDALTRRRYTQTQTKLNSEERRKNMEDAFEVRKGKEALIEGRTCLIVDDVITTGATIGACAVVLQNAGAQAVITVSAALAE